MALWKISQNRQTAPNVAQLPQRHTARQGNLAGKSPGGRTQWLQPGASTVDRRGRLTQSNSGKAGSSRRIRRCSWLRSPTSRAEPLCKIAPGRMGTGRARVLMSRDGVEIPEKNAPPQVRILRYAGRSPAAHVCGRPIGTGSRSGYTGSSARLRCNYRDDIAERLAKIACRYGMPTKSPARRDWA